MFFRALHTISTQRYRLPVRRYIVDLFNLELNPELVSALRANAVTLKAHPSYKPSNVDANRLSVFGRIRRSTESDDEDDELDAPTGPSIVPDKLPVLNLRPVSKIIGFDI